MKPEFIICSHRGNTVVYPENTMDAFQSAIDQGCNAIETDLCITKDGMVICWHDNDTTSLEANVRELGFEPGTKYLPINRTRMDVSEMDYEFFVEVCGYRPKEWMDVSEVIHGKEVPTLGRFFSFIKENRHQLEHIFFDVKTPKDRPELFDYIKEQINGYIKMFELEDDIEFIVESFHSELLDTIGYVRMKRGLDTASPVGIVLHPKSFSSVIPVLQQMYRYAIPLRPTALTFLGWSIYKKIIKYDLKVIKKSGFFIRLVPATVNDAAEMRWLIKKGVAGIQTDYVNILINELANAAFNGEI